MIKMIIVILYILVYSNYYIGEIMDIKIILEKIDVNNWLKTWFSYI